MKKFFWPNSIFCNFKNGSRKIFIDLFDFTSFLPGLFQIFWPTMERMMGIIRGYSHWIIGWLARSKLCWPCKKGLVRHSFSYYIILYMYRNRISYSYEMTNYLKKLVLETFCQRFRGTPTVPYLLYVLI